MVSTSCVVLSSRRHTLPHVASLLFYMAIYYTTRLGLYIPGRGAQGLKHKHRASVHTIALQHATRSAAVPTAHVLVSALAALALGVA